MENTKQTFRGIEASKEKVYVDAYEKEARLRLKWFRRNEERLVAYSEKPNSRTVPAEVHAQVASDRKDRYQRVEKYPNVTIGDPPPPPVDPDAIRNIMKPVEPATKKLIYSGTQKDGRRNYLKERVKILPENKYYFAETSAFAYGWNMWNSSRTATPIRYGRCQVIKKSFYRRNGVARDPDWYQEPASATPTLCGCI